MDAAKKTAKLTPAQTRALAHIESTGNAYGIPGPTLDVLIRRGLVINAGSAYIAVQK